jgi:Fe2+ or Zn2+ uptake regulation protein
MKRELSQQGILQSLHQTGLRPTIPRVLVMQVLEEAAGQPLSIDEMFRRICLGELHASPGTIYRVVQQMEKLGLVQMVRDAGRKQLFLLNAEAGLSMEEPTVQARAQPLVQLWAVNRISGERVPLHEGEWLKQLIAVVVDAGVSLEGGRLTVELDGVEACLSDPIA